MRLAVVAATLALVAGPAFASGYSEFNTGVAAHNRDDYELCIKFLTMAIAEQDLDSRLRAVAYFDRASCYSAKEQFDLAMPDLDKAIAGRPGWYNAYVLRGSIQAVKEHWPLAEQDFSSAIAARPELETAYGLRAGAFAAEERYADAIADYTTIIAQHPDKSPAYQDRSEAYENSGQIDLALSDANKAVDLDSKSADALFLRADEYDVAGRYDRAVSDIKDGLSIRANDFNAIFLMGRIRWEQGHYEDAASSLEQAIADQPENAYFTIWLAIVRSALRGPHPSPIVDAGKYDMSKWPGPILNFILGKTTVDQVSTAAAIGDDKLRQNQLCEVDFYVGAWDAAQANDAAAAPLLANAAKICPNDFIELRAAKVALARLNKGGS